MLLFFFFFGLVNTVPLDVSLIMDREKKPPLIHSIFEPGRGLRRGVGSVDAPVLQEKRALRPGQQKQNHLDSKTPSPPKKNPKKNLG